MTKKTLRKPEYWEAFEDLCKKLWGEIWDCPEIKKNGRKGQSQHGVDVYGTERRSGDLIGVQCKGKDEYTTHDQLTKKEIEDELEKAQLFKPFLCKFYFATTANKDVQIEEYIRIKNREFKEKGLFEVHLYCWEDIVELIDENKRTHDWYVNNQQYQSSHSALVTFQNDLSLITLRPTFIRHTTRYENISKFDNVDLSPVIDQFNRDNRLYGFGFDEIISKEDLISFFNKKIQCEDDQKRLDPQPVHFHFDSITSNQVKTTNLSVCCFHLKVLNTGSEVLEDLKLYFEIENVTAVDSVDKRQEMLDMNKYTYNVIFDKSNAFKAVCEPKSNVLVKEDHFNSDQLCIKTKTESCRCEIKYKLVSRNYSNEGSLTIEVDPVIEKEESVKFIENLLGMKEESYFRNKYIQEN